MKAMPVADIQKVNETFGRLNRDETQCSSLRFSNPRMRTARSSTEDRVRLASQQRSEQVCWIDIGLRGAEMPTMTIPQEALGVRMRKGAPPIDSKMNDESEGEEAYPLLQLLEYIHFSCDYPQLPEGSEEEGVRRNSGERIHRRKNSNETSSLILPIDDLCSQEAERGEPNLRPPSIPCDIPTAHPSPLPTAPVTQRCGSQQGTMPSGERDSTGTLAQSALMPEAQKKPPLASQWTVDQVIEWLKSKGFGPDVYDKFIEHEITGDVLLDLDTNVLREEIGIVAFGKRIRVANAIAELRRPSSTTLTDPDSIQSFPSILTSLGSTLASMENHESPKADGIASPFLSKDMSGLSTEGSNMNVCDQIESIIAATTIEKTEVGVARPGLKALPETQSTSSLSDSMFVTPEEVLRDIEDEFHGVQFEGETMLAATKKSRRYLFGRLTESSGSGKDKERSGTPSDTNSRSSPTGLALLDAYTREGRNSQDGTIIPARPVDVGKGSKRRSFFDGIGRSRKTARRVTSTSLEESDPAQKRSLSVVPRSRSGSDSKKRDVGRTNSVKIIRDREKPTRKQATESNLVEWANSHLPRSHQIPDPEGPYVFDGLALLLLAEDMMHKSPSPPIPDSAFPSGPDDNKLEGLTRLFDFFRENRVKVGSVSINDVRLGKRDKVMQLLKALKSWEDIRKEITNSLGQGALQSSLQYCLLP